MYRGGSEGHIRQYLIEKMNCIDAVIGMPSNIFYGTGIPTCILVMRKCRKSNDDILFIDASQTFEKVKTSNVMREEHIAQIVLTYKSRKTVEKYSELISIEKIKENDWNLNIPRYVNGAEDEIEIDLNDVATQLIELDKHSLEIHKEIDSFCKALNIQPPFSSEKR